jgi:hypothetical protein
MPVIEPGGAGRHATRRLVTVPPAAGVPDPVPLDLPGRGKTVVTDVGPRPRSRTRWPTPLLVAVTSAHAR